MSGFLRMYEMKNYQSQHEPIFFTVPSGDTKRPRTLHKGGGGGDGGAAARAAAEKERVAAGIQAINEVFGNTKATPNAIDKAAYTTTERVAVAPSYGAFGGYNSMGNMAAGNNYQTVTKFDQAGYDAAVAAEQARVDKLNSAAQQREQLYSTVAEDAKKKALLDIERERAITERELNFALARNGLSGGSRDVDANKDVLDTAQQGILKASEIGLATANDARSNDERTRVNLINSIQSGLDSGSAIQSAYTGMANNANLARDNASAASLNGFFDTLRANQNAAQYQQAVNSVIPQVKNKTAYGAPSPARGGANGLSQEFE